MAYTPLMEFTEYIAPDGVIYQFDTNTDKFLMTETGMGMPPIKYITQKGPFQHGETLIDYRLEPRIIQLLHRNNACDRQDYWDRRSDILNMLRPNRQLLNSFRPGVLRKTLPNGAQRDIKVIIEQGPEFQARNLERWDEWGILETLRFIAYDPTFYDPTQVCIVIGTVAVLDELIFYNSVTGPAYTSIEFVNPTTAPTSPGLLFASSIVSNTTVVNYTGTWLTYPTFEIIGPINGPTIRNNTTGEFISLSYSVAAGETVTISLEYGNKTVANNAGVNLIGTVTTDSNFTTFHIEPDPGATNGANTIEVTGSGAQIGVTQVNMAYYTRYIGI